MKKIISFSLWGEDPKYCVGAVKNSDLALIHYPGWICRFHIGTSTPAKYIKELQERENVEIFMRTEAGNWEGMFWRFLDASDLSAEVMISRDTDSRLTIRESIAVNDWLKSDKKFHIMRDHPNHKTEILGGMWGVKNPYLADMKYMIKNWKKGDYWQTDQEFLSKEIYPIIRNTSYINDEFFEKKPFPTARKNYEFVGQPFNADDTEFDSAHSQIIRSLEGRK